MFTKAKLQVPEAVPGETASPFLDPILSPHVLVSRLRLVNGGMQFSNDSIEQLVVTTNCCQDGDSHISDFSLNLDILVRPLEFDIKCRSWQGGSRTLSSMLSMGVCRKSATTDYDVTQHHVRVVKHRLILNVPTAIHSPADPAVLGIGG